MQVWFPGYGWQNFDPTADVPLANPSPGSVLARSAGRFLAGLPWIPLGLVALRPRQRCSSSAAGGGARRPGRTRWLPTSGRGGARLGLPRLGHETLTAYGSRLAAADLAYAEGILSVTTLVERATYAGIEPSADQISRALAFTRGFRSIPRRRPRGDAQDRAWANASSKDTPAASRGR